MVSRNHNKEQTSEFAYFDREKAVEAVKMWNEAQEAEDKKKAEEAGKSYDEWVGAYADYAFVEQVEIIQ